MNTNLLTVVEIAEVCHDLNKAYCLSQGDDTQVEWKDAPDWQKLSAIQGVVFHQHNLEASPAASHESWLREKEATGWSYGKKKSTASKKHPCMVPFEDLSEAEQAKDFIFRQTVHSLSGFKV